MLQPPYPLKGHCPRCGPDRNADIIKQHHEDYSDEESNHWGYIDYRILRCRGCERIFFQIAEYHTEEGGELQPTITHWPMPGRRPRPNWIYMFLLKNAEDCYQLFEELYAAFNNGYNILTAMGLRTAFDRVAELLGAARDKTFGEKVKFLAAQGLVGADERKALDVLVKAGNAVTHRRWSMESKEIELLISILENLVHRNLIVKFEVSLFEPRIPPRDEAKRS